ncbi:hypothetical protein [Pseudomonas luteola]|uniref:hypothetical protein n=1 Tax=Pseudomonas luteola TaxID=47886 RepID=UPI000910C086|nr:hypothetical protein [Pseudomonas zeshuii]SHI35634.1 hypothetical protein SAMN05216295_101360 [Pseudomonas zeshuii]
MNIQTQSFKLNQEELNALIADKLSDYESTSHTYNKVRVPLYQINDYLEQGYTVFESRFSYIGSNAVLMLKPTQLQETEKQKLTLDITAAYTAAVASNWASLEQTVLEGVKEQMLTIKADQLREKHRKELEAYEASLQNNFQATMTYINTNLDSILAQIHNGEIK